MSTQLNMIDILNSCNEKATKIMMDVTKKSLINEYHINEHQNLEDIKSVIKEEENGQLVTFADCNNPSFESTKEYVSGIPRVSIIKKPTSTTHINIAHTSFNSDVIINKEQLKLSNDSLIKEYISSLSKVIYSNDQDKLKEVLSKISELDFLSIETSKNRELKEEVRKKIEKVDNLINSVEKEDLGGFLSYKHNAFYLALILNLLSVERFIYFMNWLEINNSNFVCKFYKRLFEIYEELRDSVVESAINPDTNELDISKDTRFQIVSIAHFFERQRQIQKEYVFHKIFQDKNEEFIERLLIKIIDDI